MKTKTNLLLLSSLSSVAILVSMGLPYSNNSNSAEKDSFGSGRAVDDVGSSFVMKSDNQVSYGNIETLSIAFNEGQVVDEVRSQNLVVKSTNVSNDEFTALVEVENAFSVLSVSFLQSNTEDMSIGCGNSEGEGEYSVSYYLYSKNNVIYTSSLSLDTAILSAGDDPEVVNPSSIIPNDKIFPPITPVEFNGYRGTIQWRDNDGNIYPLAGAKVSVTRRNSLSNLPDTKEFYTNENGYFNTVGVLYGTAIEGTLKLYLSGENVSVRRVDSLKDNYSEEGFNKHTIAYSMSLSEYAQSLVDGTPLIISSQSAEGNVSDFGAATQIFEAMYYYSKYAKGLNNGSIINYCSAVYPCSRNYSVIGFPTVGGFMYTGHDSTIIIPPEKPENSIPCYESWDVIGHEYGHHVGKCLQCCVGIGAYSHYAYRENINNLIKYENLSEQNGINKGLSLTWSESWPSYWSEIAQTSFPSSIKEHYSNGYVADKAYEAYNFSPVNYYSIEQGEHFSDINCSYIGGEAYEVGIIRFLYELNRNVGGYSTTDTPNNDYLWDYVVDCGEQFFSNAIFNNMKFSDFYNYLYSLTQTEGLDNPITIDMLSEVASDYLIAPVKVGTQQKSDGVDLYWQIGGYHNGLQSIGDAYLTFYDENGIEYKRQPLSHTCISKGTEYSRARYKAKITSDMLSTVSSPNMKIGIAFSPNYYNWTNVNGDDFGYTGPYARIIWEGQSSSLSLQTISNINLDSDL